MNYRRGTTRLDLLDNKDSWPSVCRVEELPMPRKGIWLVPRCQIGACDTEKDGRDVAAIGDCCM